MASVVAAWPMVALGEVLRQDTTYISELEPRLYPKLSVPWWGKGVVLDPPADGSLVRMTRHQLAKPGQVIVSEIWAKHGSIGIVPPEGAGALVTSHFFLFDVDEMHLLREYMGYLITANYLTEQIAEIARGTTGYASIRPHHFLCLTVPLPPLDEQRRIVARIEELAAHIEEARGLRREAVGEAERLLIAMAHRADLDSAAKQSEGWRRVTIGEVVSLAQDAHRVDSANTYPNFGIYSFGRGLFPKPPIDGLSTSAGTLYRVRAGQFIYSRLFAFEGAYGMVTEEFDGCFVSGEYPTFVCDESQVTAAFLFAYFKAPHIWSEVAEGSKGLGDRRQRVHPEQVLAHRLWLPPLSWQKQLAEVRVAVNTMTAFQAETTVELDALLPSVLDRAFRGEL